MDWEEFNALAERLKRKAAAGDVQAMKWLGDLYYQGPNKTDRNVQAAFPYWKMAADNGDYDMAFKVGLCYQTGDGGVEDERAAFHYLLKSANTGNAEAQYRVGLCLYHGIGTEEDQEAGIRYIKLAAQQHHAGAMEALGVNNKGNDSGGSSSSDGGGCYIATAVYGSYDAPEVLTLRHFRDNTLHPHWWGRLFIRTYYLLSPPVAERLKNATRINLYVRSKLDRFVEKLKSQEEKS